MKILSIHHVPFEGLGSLEGLIKRGAHSLDSLEMWKTSEVPNIESYDLLIVMGGPMGVEDSSIHPWLLPEYYLIEDAIRKQKKVLGICLGAQMVAKVLGAKVFTGAEKEIGWYPIHKAPDADDCRIGEMLPGHFEAYHWHGDQFTLPGGSVHLGSSENCDNQGFVWKERVVALQFHLETTRATAEALIRNSESELAEGGRFVQDPEAMLESPERFARINGLMERIWTTLNP